MKIKATICKTVRFEVEIEVGDSTLIVEVDDIIKEVIESMPSPKLTFEETKIANVRIEQ